MLPRMLLHVVKTPRPVNLPGHGNPCGKCGRQDMDHVAVGVHRFDYAGRAETAGIEQLSTR